MNEQQLYLWCAHPEDDLSESATRACANLLSREERARWQRFPFARHRREYLTTRVLVRFALSQCHPLPPDAWRFQVNKFGKPAAEPECSLKFNLSNSPGLVVCLVARGVDVGVDVEPFERAGKIADLAPEVFSPLEMVQLEDLRGQERLDRALSLWTLKEAFIKARGMGLSMPLKKFSFLFESANEIRLELDSSLRNEPGRSSRFCVLDYAGHRIATMVESKSVPRMQLWEMRPLLAIPKRLPLNDVRWFQAS